MSDKPSNDKTNIIERAINAIGVHDNSDDHILDVCKHAKTLEHGTDGLCEILLQDEAVGAIGAEYQRLDARADTARCRFECWIFLLGLVGVTAALFAVFVIVVPLELPLTLLVCLSIVVALFLVSFLNALWVYAGIGNSVRNFRFFREREFGKASPRWLGLVWTFRAVLLATCGAAAFLYIVPQLFAVPSQAATHAQPLLLLAIVILAAAMFLAHLFGGKLKRQWYEARGQAEALRRSLFAAVVIAATERKASNAATANALPLLSQALEYFRRYHIEVQQTYFRGKATSNRAGANFALGMKRVASWTFLVMLAIFSIASIGSYVEQGHQLVGFEWISAKLIEFSMAGWNDVVVVLALLALGTYLVSQLRTTLLNESRNAIRFNNALVELRNATSAEPGAANLELSNPLTEARFAAAKNEHARVEQFIREINLLLAAEVGDWSYDTPYAIKRVGSPARVRLTSAVTLSADVDFDRVSRDVRAFGCETIKARKTGFVAARQAQQSEHVETRYEGKESHDRAEPGDWIVTNMDKDRKLIKDVQKHVNTYVIRETKFGELYERDKDETEFGDVFRSKSFVDVDAIELPGGFDIVAPWRERQQAAKGLLIRNGQDVYGIHASAFDQTYEHV